YPFPLSGAHCFLVHQASSHVANSTRHAIDLLATSWSMVDRSLLLFIYMTPSINSDNYYLMSAVQK
ncbi:hypothetical protein ACWIVX_14505, partial [Enterobacter asburiae]